MTSDYPVEHVLVVPPSLFHEIGHFQGFCPDIDVYLERLLDPAEMSFRPRDTVEEDPSQKQLIPYCVFRHDGRIFSYRRGTEQGEGRLHSKRSIGIDMNSVHFCTPEQIERFGRFALLEDYISSKQVEVTEYNQRHGIDTTEVIIGRRLTNLGTLRAYLVEYLRRHSGINNEMTLMVRQLSPSSEGIPIEIYVFSLDKDWGVYEALQADIFDHLLSVISEFDLRVFQSPTGTDMAQIGETG